ncbi:MAG: PilZ domain-containing protein [Oligoflexia bacterium]|nr:PilZ domain-containing protein [Oligoflexia bacterium]
MPPLAHDPKLRVKIADTKEELEQAYRLLHDCYVGQGLMSPHPSGLRCNIYSLLPETSTVIVKHGEKIVGTCALIRDSRMNLPSDGIFLEQNNQLRREGGRLIEASALAVDREYRSTGHAMSFLLMKFMYHYALNVHGTHLVATLHPRAQDFYEGLWSFERLGPVAEYKYVNKALAVYMHLPLNPLKLLEMVARYESADHARNIVLWAHEDDPRLLYPSRENGQIMDPVMTPDLLEYFFLEKTDLFEKLNPEQRKLFFEIYLHYFDASQLKRFATVFPDVEDLRPLRVLINLPAGMRAGHDFHIVKLLDISSGGAYVEFRDFDPRSLYLGKQVELFFRIGSRSFQAASQIAWCHQGHGRRYPPGFGVRFATPLIGLKDELKKFVYHREAA